MFPEHQTQIYIFLKYGMGENAVITKTSANWLLGFPPRFPDSAMSIGRNPRYHGNSPKLRIDFRFFLVGDHIHPPFVVEDGWLSWASIYSFGGSSNLNPRVRTLVQRNLWVKNRYSSLPNKVFGITTIGQGAVERGKINGDISCFLKCWWHHHVRES